MTLALTACGQYLVTSTRNGNVARLRADTLEYVDNVYMNVEIAGGMAVMPNGNAIVAGLEGYVNVVNVTGPAMVAGDRMQIPSKRHLYGAAVDPVTNTAYFMAMDAVGCAKGAVSLNLTSMTVIADVDFPGVTCGWMPSGQVDIAVDSLRGLVTFGGYGTIVLASTVTLQVVGGTLGTSSRAARRIINTPVQGWTWALISNSASTPSLVAVNATSLTSIFVNAGVTGIPGSTLSSYGGVDAALDPRGRIVVVTTATVSRSAAPLVPIKGRPRARPPTSAYTLHLSC